MEIELINRSFFIGRLTAEPVIKKTKKGISCSNFQLAVEYEKGKIAFPEFIVYGSLAEAFVKYVKKGNLICVTAHYTSHIHNQRKYHIFKVDELLFLEGRKNYEKADDVEIPQ